MILRLCFLPCHFYLRIDLSHVNNKTAPLTAEITLMLFCTFFLTAFVIEYYHTEGPWLQCKVSNI